MPSQASPPPPGPFTYGVTTVIRGNMRTAGWASFEQGSRQRLSGTVKLQTLFSRLHAGKPSLDCQNRSSYAAFWHCQHRKHVTCNIRHTTGPSSSKVRLFWRRHWPSINIGRKLGSTCTGTWHYRTAPQYTTQTSTVIPLRAANVSPTTRFMQERSRCLPLE